MTKEAIISAINDHIRLSQQQYYNQFYIGITEDVEERLFGYHRVQRTNHWWIYRFADNEEIAREVEKYYLNLGMRGGSGGGTGNGDALCVYCYVITNYTVE